MVEWTGLLVIGGVGAAVVGGVIACILLYVVMRRTTFGLAVDILGGNQRAARMAGLPINRMVLTCCFLGGAGARAGRPPLRIQERPAHVHAAAGRTSRTMSGNMNSDEHAAAALLSGPLGVINLGLQEFARDLADHGVAVVHVDWSPPAGGDAKLADLLSKLNT